MRRKSSDQSRKTSAKSPDVETTVVLCVAEVCDVFCRNLPISPSTFRKYYRDLLDFERIGFRKVATEKQVLRVLNICKKRGHASFGYSHYEALEGIEEQMRIPVWEELDEETRNCAKKMHNGTHDTTRTPATNGRHNGEPPTDS